MTTPRGSGFFLTVDAVDDAYSAEIVARASCGRCGCRFETSVVLPPCLFMKALQEHATACAPSREQLLREMCPEEGSKLL